MNPEQDDGNIEYKLKLISKSDERIQELITQMRFRCMEGNGECFYNLGVEDDGNLVGITNEEYEETIRTLNIIAEKNDYHVQILSKNNVCENKNIYEVLIRENNNKYIDIKVCVAGNVNASKSSTIGCLVTGNLDNGRGLSRMSVFNYVHELKTGRTSSISHEILGYDYKGNIINYQGLNKLSSVSYTHLRAHET